MFRFLTNLMLVVVYLLGFTVALLDWFIWRP
jgi:hypothetical protein